MDLASWKLCLQLFNLYIFIQSHTILIDKKDCCFLGLLSYNITILTLLLISHLIMANPFEIIIKRLNYN